VVLSPEDVLLIVEEAYPAGEGETRVVWTAPNGHHWVRFTYNGQDQNRFPAIDLRGYEQAGPAGVFVHRNTGMIRFNKLPNLPIKSEYALDTVHWDAVFN